MGDGWRRARDAARATQHEPAPPVAAFLAACEASPPAPEPTPVAPTPEPAASLVGVAKGDRVAVVGTDPLVVLTVTWASARTVRTNATPSGGGEIDWTRATGKDRYGGKRGRSARPRHRAR